MKKTICLAVIAALAFGLCACGQNTSTSGGTADDTAQTTAAQEADTTRAEFTDADGNYIVTDRVQMKLKGFGTLDIELYGKLAPITVNNFLSLVKSGFYDGLTFHRIIKGFMMQGGDPQANGNGGAKEYIKGEFSQNGFYNPLLHERGVLSMARGGNNFDSGSSQFFIMQKTKPHLDGGYAAFGKVTKGMKIVDKICNNTPTVPEDNGYGELIDNGKVAADNQPVIEWIKIVK